MHMHPPSQPTGQTSDLNQDHEIVMTNTYKYVNENEKRCSQDYVTGSRMTDYDVKNANSRCNTSRSRRDNTTDRNRRGIGR